MAEIHLELLLGSRIFDENDKVVGRLEEFRAEEKAGEIVVTEYHVGSYAFLERLSAWTIGRALLQTAGATSRRRGYRVPWDKLDLSDLRHLRLKCPAGELKPLSPGK
jgi:hypothetical protein